MNIISCFCVAVASMLLLENGLQLVPESTWVKNERVDEVLQKYGCHTASKALSASKKMIKLKNDLGISEKELFELALFIETELPHWVNRGCTYLKKEQTGQVRTIEYDSLSKQVFIHLKTHGIDPIGKGRYKKVTYSIKYGRNRPLLVANCVLHHDGSSRVMQAIQSEAEALKQLAFCKGVANTYSVTEHDKQNGVHVTSFIQKMYAGGGLKKYFLTPGSLSRNEQLILARDYFSGLEQMHERNLVHCDLHAGNLLIHRSYDPKTKQEQLSGVLIDFGHAKSVESALATIPKIQATRRRNPPEVYASDTSNVDPKAVDVYALAVSLYHIYFKNEAEWIRKRYFKNIAFKTKDQLQELSEFVQTNLQTHLAKRLSETDDEYALLILQACDPDPRNRPTARQMRQRLDQIMRAPKKSTGSGLFADTVDRAATPDDEWATEERLDEVAVKYGIEALTRTLTMCEKIWKLKDPLGLTKHELFKLVLFIETKLSGRIEKGKYYLRKERTRLPRTIEYDPVSKRTFIHLKKHGIAGLGEGWHKSVTRSIMYDLVNPRCVANCVMQIDTNCEREIAIVKKLPREKGLVRTYAVTTHTKKTKNTPVVSFLQRLYNSHSLYHYQHKYGELNKKQMLCIGRDAASGLASLHKHNYIHRDLHGGNFLLRRKVDSVTKEVRMSAAIIDFGQSMKSYDAVKMAPQIEVPERFNAPDAFYRTKSNIDPKAVEVYALGLNLYHLWFGVQPEWATKERFSGIGHLSDNGKVGFRRKLIEDIEKQIAVRENTLSGISLYDEYARIILQMCHSNPFERPTAAAIYENLSHIIEKIEADTK